MIHQTFSTRKIHGLHVTVHGNIVFKGGVLFVVPGADPSRSVSADGVAQMQVLAHDVIGNLVGYLGVVWVGGILGQF
jgi:hypothetical protein